jgi:hypothetical protein
MKSTNEKNGLQLELMANRFGIDDATVIKVTSERAIIATADD